MLVHCSDGNFFTATVIYFSLNVTESYVYHAPISPFYFRFSYTYSPYLSANSQGKRWRFKKRCSADGIQYCTKQVFDMS